jgi:hypothetical protein
MSLTISSSILAARSVLRKLPPQTLARAITQMREVIFEVAKVQRQSRHRHARTRVKPFRENPARVSRYFEGKILQNDQ